MADLITPGIVAYVKASEEPVFVVSTRPATDDEFIQGFSGQLVTVRRFHIDGYRNETFLVEELETSGEQHVRKYKEMSGLRQTFEASPTSETFHSN